MNSCFISSLEIASIFVTFDFHFSPRQSLNAYIADINDDFQKYNVLKMLKKDTGVVFLLFCLYLHTCQQRQPHT